MIPYNLYVSFMCGLDEPVFMAGPKPMRTEYGIHQRLESCADHKNHDELFSVLAKNTIIYNRPWRV